MHPRLATFLSTLGNPFLLFPLIISYLAIQEVGIDAARPLMITLAVIFALLSAFLLLRKLQGNITNLDVSDRKQRARNVYLPAIAMLLLAAAYFWWTGQPYFYQTLYVGLLLVTCFAINTKIKISMHTMVATYLSALLLASNIWLGVAFFVFAALIAWSRVVLGRHTRKEVLLGWAVGSAFGLLHVYLF